MTSSGSENTQSSSSGCESIQSSSSSQPLISDSSSGFEPLISASADDKAGNRPFGSANSENVQYLCENMSHLRNENMNNGTDEQLNEKVVFDINGACNQTDESKLQSCDGYAFAANDEIINKQTPVPNSNNIPSIKLENECDIKPGLNGCDIKPGLNGCDINHDLKGADKQPYVFKSSLYPPAPHSVSSDSGSAMSLDTDRDGYLILDKPEVRQICQEEIHGTWLSVNLKVQQSQFRNKDNLDDVDGACAPR